jgi:hypothetical protein
VRWLVVVVVMSVLAPARAERVVLRRPELAFTCATAPSWAAVETCITQHGWKMIVARTLAHAKVIELVEPGPETGLALYMEHANGKWSLAGQLDAQTGTFELLDVAPIKLGHTEGFRLDIGMRQQTGISPDSVTSIEGFELTKHVLYCSGLGTNCAAIIPSCDVILDGRIYSTFHGEIHITGHELAVEGDATFAMPLCNGPQRQQLNWP